MSACGRYRYALERELAREATTGPARSLCWLMLNPSVADGRVDDPTIRKVMGFTRREGYTRAVVVNLYAWRATDPRDLRRQLAIAPARAEGPRNRAAITRAASGASAVVCAWGATPWARAQAERVLEWLGAVWSPRAAAPLLCLGRTKDGAPRHPLMLAYDDHPLVPFERATAWPWRGPAVGCARLSGVV